MVGKPVALEFLGVERQALGSDLNRSTWRAGGKGVTDEVVDDLPDQRGVGHGEKGDTVGFEGKRHSEAVSLGLRRRTDAARGLVERTRGDVTNALQQARLEEKMAQFQAQIGDDD